MRVFIQLPDGEQIQVSHVLYEYGKLGMAFSLAVSYLGEMISVKSDTFEQALSNLAAQVAKQKRSSVLPTEG